MKLSVILVLHQSAPALPACLAALADCPLEEVIGVDNASTDGSADLAAARGARIFRLPRNTGFASAANCGARESKGDLLCFLNPDCQLTAEAIAEAQRGLTPQTRACAVPDFFQHGQRVAGRQAGYTRRKSLSDILEHSGWPSAWIRRLQAHRHYHDVTRAWPLGTCLFIPRAFFFELGGFGEQYFLYMEDVALGDRIFAAGGSVLALPAMLHHQGQAGSVVPARDREIWLNNARIQYARERFGRPWAFGLRVLLVLGACRTLVKSKSIASCWRAE